MRRTLSYWSRFAIEVMCRDHHSAHVLHFASFFSRFFVFFKIGSRHRTPTARDYIGNSQRSLLSPTGGVKRISPDTATHEQNGYAIIHNDKYTLKTIVDNDNSDTTYMTYTNMREV